MFRLQMSTHRAVSSHRARGLSAACVAVLVLLTTTEGFLHGPGPRTRRLIRLSSGEGPPEVSPEKEGGGLLGSWPFAPNINLPAFSAVNFVGGSLVGGFVALAVLFVPILLDIQEFGGSPVSINGNAVTKSNTGESSTLTKSKKSVEQESREVVTLFDNILTDLRLGYVDVIDPRKLFETGISAMLRSLDPYTEFENVKATQSIQESVSGRYGGVGLVIANTQVTNPGVKVPATLLGTTPAAIPSPLLPAASPAADGVSSSSSSSSKNGVTVVDAFEGYAYQSGMRVGDHIIAVDGQDTTKMDVEGVRDLLRGDPDTSIQVSFEREEYGGKKVYDLTLQRRQVKLSDVRLACFLGDRRDRIGYINLAGFNAGAGRDFRSAYLMLKYLALEEQLRGSQSESAQAPTLQDPVLTAELSDVLRAYRTPRHYQEGSERLLALGPGNGNGDALAVAAQTNAYSPQSQQGREQQQDTNAPPIPQRGAGLAALVLDLRGNPGGLLDAAVEIASYLVPAHSDIVSARSREGPEIIYRSVIDPIRSPETRLVVLVNGGSASASEIVAGAIQDLDAGVIVGQSKTYGKGLVQKILPLPYDSALKYTIAKYFTPSGRCIQSINYSGGRQDDSSSEAADGLLSAESTDGEASRSDSSSGSGSVDGAKTIRDSDRKTFLTVGGRQVLDGGGINPDVTVPPNVLAPSESIFLREGLYSKFMSSYIQSHDVLPSLREVLSKQNNDKDNAPMWNRGAFGPAVEQFIVYDAATPAQSAAQKKLLTRYNNDLYAGFRKFVVEQKQQNKLAFKLAAVDKLAEIEKSLEAQGLEKAAKEIDQVIPKLQNVEIVENMDANEPQIKTSLELALLSRELPDRLLLREAIKEDPQILEATELLREAIRASASSSSASDSGKVANSKYVRLLQPGMATASVPTATGGK